VVDDIIGLMEPSEQLLDELGREDREQARQMTPWQRFRAGGDLFDNACRWTLAGIRNQNPHFTKQQALDELQRRIDGALKREDA
jgi:hypothetical protein